MVLSLYGGRFPHAWIVSSYADCFLMRELFSRAVVLSSCRGTFLVQWCSPYTVDVFLMRELLSRARTFFVRGYGDIFSIPYSRTYAHPKLPGCGIKQKTVSSLSPIPQNSASSFRGPLGGGLSAEVSAPYGADTSEALLPARDDTKCLFFP